MSKFIAIVLLFGLINIYVPGGSAIVCSRNEISLECKGCDQYCGGRPKFCTKICLPGCSCKKGYVRSAAHSNGCISSELCKQIIAESAESTTEREITTDEIYDDEIRIA